MQIIREIAKKVAQIQNAGLGEFRIRDLNDEINKLLREKRHWEAQIKELGGPDYSRVGPRMLDHEGREVISQIIITMVLESMCLYIFHSSTNECNTNMRRSNNRCLEIEVTSILELPKNFLVSENYSNRNHRHLLGKLARN